jgi:RNA polymerase sigma factor (sigma-70 family)
MADTFAEVYRCTYRSSVMLAYATTGSLADAEDIAQEAYTQLYRALGRVREPTAWVRRAVISLSTSWVRRQVRQRSANRDAETANLAPDPESRLVWHALTSLSLRQRHAVLLRYEADLTEREIARILGCRPGTVKSLLSRALTTLKQEMARDD